MHVDGRRNLLAVGFVGRLEEGMAHAEGESQVGLDAPGVLQIVLELVGSEMAVDEGTVRKSAPPVGLVTE